jgi:hypothetical protein
MVGRHAIGWLKRQPDGTEENRAAHKIRRKSPMSKNEKTSPPKSLRYYLLELLVVFLGVTMAFMLGNWRENRQISSLERHYIQNIYSDLEQDRESLDEILHIVEGQLSMLEKYLYSPGDDWTVDSTSEVIVNSLLMVNFYGTSSTYESLKYSGHLSYIKDFDTRKQIVTYYENFLIVGIVEDLSQKWLLETLTPYYIEHFDLVRGRFIDDATGDDDRLKNMLQGLYVLTHQRDATYRNLLNDNRTLYQTLDER